jgi:hypothetical protein
MDLGNQNESRRKEAEIFLKRMEESSNPQHIDTNKTGVLSGGWVCPVCGAGLAPWTSRCNHGKPEQVYY